MITSLASSRFAGVVAACAACALASDGAAAEPRQGEVLPNGIVLPPVWPERTLDAKSREPMPVPYLVAPPAVIPIDVGRQLFVDDYLIANSTLRRTWHAAEEVPGNPILAATTPPELTRTTGIEGAQEAVCYLGSGGVWFDPAAQQFKLWYTAGWRGGLALATSRDAIHWERPALGRAGDNLVLPEGKGRAGWDNGVWLDLQAPAAERYKFLTQRSSKDHSLHVSADGLTWSAGVQTGPAADYCTFFYNPFRQVWVHSIKRNGPRGRERHYAESRTFMTAGVYRQSVYWTNADRLDSPDPQVGAAPQLYNLQGIAYESLILGVFSIHLGPTNEVCEAGRFPKITELKLGFSRDGFHWDRPNREPFLRASRREGAWNRGYLHCPTGVCVVVGDWLYFPYTGFSGVAPSGWRGMYTGASIGLARLRRDGFASMDTGAEGGSLTTRPVRFAGERLFVNVACPQGALRVEVLDPEGNVIAPFGAAECVPVSADTTRREVRWRQAETLAALRDRPVRFRFHLTQGRLYAFWVSPDRSGASYGYVAAGGPGFAGATDREGAAADAAAAAARPPVSLSP
ncbi:glycosyl hydrolase family 32 [Opitutus sp. ER46]|uniref:glycosyl hydrolase family 32 n=1 Tax=Opitutus sp. ER46 TaxID=2161864 RepID=UPI000D30BE3C|nr:glycosyl hydrolase family 32 [Opitutus sp. ER46]PTX91527.1 glycosyl hydrolase family 32 [Opitutus sp. ER46]